MKHMVIVNIKIVGSRKIRIVFISSEDPCKWQIQRRHRLFFWKDMYGPFSSLETALRESKAYLAGES